MTDQRHDAMVADIEWLVKKYRDAVDAINRSGQPSNVSAEVQFIELLTTILAKHKGPTP